MSFRVRADVARGFALLLGLALVAAPARAQEAAVPARSLSVLLTKATPITTLRDERGLDGHSTTAAGRGVLVPLYLSFASLQMLDAHSTLRAVRAGGVEQNPLLSGLADKPAALVALKAGVAVSTIALADKMRGRNRVAAIVLMAALNSGYAAVVVHNYRTVP